ncbi:MAG: ABC transporter permease [Oscillospiraceae bacterium]|nr:ABC transporter permease [Oscillospiraceae bacterium]
MKKKLIIIILNILFLTAFLVCHAVSASIIVPLLSQQAAKAWAGQSGERFAQVSVFFPKTYEFNEQSIMSARAGIESALIAASMESGRDGRILYTDAWSADGRISIIGERGESSATVIGVGGDYFLFHPQRLRSGVYLSPNSLMKDYVILDEELAWRLFGAVDLSGMEVMIGSRPFKIAGVIARETDFASTKAYEASGGGAGLYMPYETLNEIMGSQAKIHTYEIVLPDPITGFAFDTLKGAFPDTSLRIIQNTSRFETENLLGIIGSFGERAMSTNAADVPYWENAALFAEDWLALLLFLSYVFMVYPAACAVYYSVKLIRFGIRKGKDKIKDIIKRRDNRAYERYIKQRQLPKTRNEQDSIRLP